MSSTISDNAVDTTEPSRPNTDGGRSSRRPTSAISSAAQRMRLLRQRRRGGLFCVMIELHQDEIERLVALGHLRRPSRNRAVLAKGLHRLFDDVLAADGDK